MAKQLVTVVDSSGKQFRSRLTWAESKRSNGDCVLGADGVYRFLDSQHNSNAGSVSGLSAARDRYIHLMATKLRPNEPTPDQGATFLSYPQPTRCGLGQSLRSMYPTLASAGAGLR